MTRLRTSGTPPRSDVETLAAADLLAADGPDLLAGRPGPDLPAHPRRRDRPGGRAARARTTRAPSPTRSAGCPTTCGPTPWPPSTTTRPRCGSPGSAPPTRPGSGSQYHFARPLTFDHLDLQIVADGQHSVPTRLTVTTDSGQATVDPAAAGRLAGGRLGGRRPGRPSRRCTGRSIRITVDTVRIENTLNYYSQTPIAMPIGIAAVGFPGVSRPPRCRPTSRPRAATTCSPWTAPRCGSR